MLAATLTSCDKEDIGGTAVESMAGQWYVDVDAVDEDGNVIEGGEHYFDWDEDRVMILTYNTSDNSRSEMYIDDIYENFNLAYYYGYDAYPNYSIKSKVNVDLKTLTFSSVEADNELGDYPVTIEGGKILKGAGRQNNGSPADSIVFYVRYTGDPWYPEDGYDRYRVSGIRYSGLVEND